MNTIPMFGRTKLTEVNLSSGALKATDNNLEARNVVSMMRGFRNLPVRATTRLDFFRGLQCSAVGPF